MHRTRQETSKLFPITRKGTKYVVRSQGNLEYSVPVLIAVRDILKLAKTAKEVKEMIKEKILKVNGRTVIRPNESINLFSILEAGKSYRLSLLPTKKFTLEEVSNGETRLCKVVNKRILKGKVVQYNLHDGSNIVSKDKLIIGDSIYLDFEGKMKKHITFESGKEGIVIKGKYLGHKGKIESIEKNKVKIKFKETSAELNQSQVVVI